MRGAIIQPSFLPWRGFFHVIQKSEIFVFLDDVQYDKHSWRNRNRIKTSQGVQWITVPVLTSGRSGQRICETKIRNDTPWRDKLLHAIYYNYQPAPYFRDYFPIFKGALSREWASIADLDILLTLEVMKLLGIKTPTVRSSELGVSVNEKNERVIRICKKLGIHHYISGPSAKDYMIESAYSEHGLSVEFMRYEYPPYDQLHGAFEPQVSVIDLLFNQGPGSSHYIWNAS